MLLWNNFVQTCAIDTPSVRRWGILLILAAMLCAPSRMWANCATIPCQVALPASIQNTSSGPLSNLATTSLQLQFRLVGVNWAATNDFRSIVQFGGFGIHHLGSANPALVYLVEADTISGDGSPKVNFAGSANNDITFCYTRNVSGMTIQLQAYDTQTGVSLVIGGGTYTITSLASSSTIAGTGISIGNTNATGNLAFMRVVPTNVPCAHAPVAPPPLAASLGDWEFNNSGTDASGLGQNFGFSGVYSSAPKYGPSCTLSSQISVPLGSTFNLDGSNSIPLDGGRALTYAWTYFSGSDGVNQGITITSPNSATTTTSASTQFGSADFQLQVTDGSGVSTTCSVHDGVYIANSNGTTNLTAEGLDATSQRMIGPTVPFGTNPWPYADATQKKEADLQIGNLTNFYTPFWRTPMPGHIQLTGGSNIATTTDGANLLAVCGGSGSTPLNDAVLLVHYRRTIDGADGYFETSVTSCTDSTHIVMSLTYPTSPNVPWQICTSACTFTWQWGYGDATGCTYSPQCEWGFWAFGGAPGNYYDN